MPLRPLQLPRPVASKAPKDHRELSPPTRRLRSFLGTHLSRRCANLFRSSPNFFPRYCVSSDSSNPTWYVSRRSAYASLQRLTVSAADQISPLWHAQVTLINANRNDFYLLLNTPITPGQGAPRAGPRPGQVQVTPAENAAIERLVAMGFDKGLVVQVSN